MVQQKQIQLGTMRLQVRSLAWLCGLGIWHCYELWCRSQMRLGFHIAVAVVQAGSYSYSSTPSLGTSICRWCGPKKWTKNQKKKKSLTPELKKLINKVKRPATEQEKVFTNHVSDKKLISKIYKKFIQQKKKKKIKKWTNKLNIYFSLYKQKRPTYYKARMSQILPLIQNFTDVHFISLYFWERH